CSCARRVWHLLADDRLRAVVCTAECWADGMATDAQLGSADCLAAEVHRVFMLDEDSYADATAEAHALDCASKALTYLAAELISPPYEVADWAAEAVGWTASGRDWDSSAYRAEVRAHADLLRDVFGNPFRPVVINPAWLTADVVALAQAAYNQRLL